MPSSSFAVIISIALSSVINSQASTRSPLIRPAIHAFAKPGPISAATSIIDTALSKERWLPSGSVIVTGVFIEFSIPNSGDLYQRSHVVFNFVLR